MNWLRGSTFLLPLNSTVLYYFDGVFHTFVLYVLNALFKPFLRYMFHLILNKQEMPMALFIDLDAHSLFYDSNIFTLIGPHNSMQSSWGSVFSLRFIKMKSAHFVIKVFVVAVLKYSYSAPFYP